LDTKTYQEFDLGAIQHCQRTALECIDIASGEFFSGSTREYLEASSLEKDIPQFHAIPKVHKELWTLRPIVPSHSWVTRRSSEVCDVALRELHRLKYPWVVDSSREVIKRLWKSDITRSDDIWLVTGDVEAFYTNVNIDGTIEQIKKDLVDLPISSDYNHEGIPDLLDIVMNFNCFTFQGRYFYQRNGIAMGTSCAPSFANVNLGQKEVFVEDIVNLPKGPKKGLIFYVRYIDDIFLVYKGSRTDLQSLLNEMSQKFSPFKIGWEISSSLEAKPFLDMELFFEQGFGPVGLQTRVYRKRMNKHQYIPWSSAHPIAVKKAFIKAELTRFMTISSSRKLYEERVMEFMDALNRRGYPASTLRLWTKQVNYKDRLSSLLNDKEKSKGLPLMLPSSYDEIWELLDVQSVFEIMQKEWSNNREPLPVQLHGPLIKSLKRTDNLFDWFSSWNKAVLKD